MPPPLTTSLTQIPPKLPTLPPKTSPVDANALSRRNSVLLLSTIITTPLFSSIFQPPLASAFSLGISGPKEWLKEQKKKSAKFLLAPVDASRNILKSAYVILMESGEEFGTKEVEQVQNLLVSAARDCVPQDRNSFVEFQSNTGVEVCTFRLILKNASDLMDKKDPIKLDAESKLSDLIRSFASLNGIARGDTELTSNRQKVADALKDTISSLNYFEQGIKDCLEA